MQTEKLLSDIQSDDKDVRFAAWRAAGDADPSVIAPLSKLVALQDKPGVAKAAREAITTMTHAVGKDAAHPKRSAVVRQLLAVAGSDSSSLAARVLAFRLLSNIAAEDSVPAIAKWIAHPDLREEVAYCLERIPGPASDKAIAAAYRSSKDDFKPRLLAALGHRRSSEGITACVEAMKSGDAELAAAAARAFGRIGKKQVTVAWPNNVEPDAVLRYADGLRESNNAADAVRIYKTMLGRQEEHLQCAAIIGLARVGSPEAATAIHPLLKSTNRKVRITAANAWRAMA
jgi:HEAT repeat protein